jgi:hypothetical protein
MILQRRAQVSIRIREQIDASVVEVGTKCSSSTIP